MSLWDKTPPGAREQLDVLLRDVSVVLPATPEQIAEAVRVGHAEAEAFRKSISVSACNCCWCRRY